MTKFDVRFSDNKVIAIYDKRYNFPVDITNGKGDFGNLVFTKKDVDINLENKPKQSPYNEHYLGYSFLEGNTLKNSENSLSLSIEHTKYGLCLHQVVDIKNLDSTGIFLPLNFMPCKNGEWRQQYLISSPYHTQDKKHWLYYFTKPDGKNLVLIVEGDVCAYKFNYSDFSCGHFIKGFSFLTNFDSAYNQPRNQKHDIKVHIIPVESYFDALKFASEIWGIPAVYYDMQAVKIGAEFEFEIIGKADEFLVALPNGETKKIKENKYFPTTYGFYTVIPYNKGVPGADCTFFTFDSVSDLYKRAVMAINDDEEDIIGVMPDGTKVWRPAHLFYRGYHDHNLCENCMWAPSFLRNAYLFGRNEKIDKAINNFMHIVLNEEGSPQVKRCSISVEEGYYTLDSDHRIQEVYAGVSLLLDAYKVYGEEKYLDFAIEVLTARINEDLENGMVVRKMRDERKDYTTVTCMVLPIVDLAVFLKEKQDSRYKFFEDAAISVADFVASRGMDFPTEGQQPQDFNTEMEEGSMSCSALTVMYVAKKLKSKPEYFEFAKQVLSYHDAYTVHTPHPVLFRSSLRWWETIWEGDHNGPAVCFGHAWSIWRAEAQYFYGILALDDKRLLDSYNGFMGNYAKVDKQGKTYAIYQYESISSGAETEDGSKVERTLKEGFPTTVDRSLAHYVFVRDFECWMRTAAIVNVNRKIRYLGCHIENGEIIFDGVKFERLYIGDVSGEFTIRTKETPEIICKNAFTLSNTTDKLIIENN